MNYQIHCRGLQVTQLLDIHVAICSCWWFNHNARGWGNLYHNIILGWCKASRGWAFAHSIHADSTGEGLNFPLLAYCLCSQRFIGVNMCACSSGNRSATLCHCCWVRLWHLLHNLRYVLQRPRWSILLNSFEPKLSFRERAWVQGYSTVRTWMCRLLSL